MMSETQTYSAEERLTEILERPRKPKPTPLQLATLVLLFLLLIIAIYNTNTAARQAADAAVSAKQDSETNRQLLQGIENLILSDTVDDERARDIIREAVESAAFLVRQEGAARDEELLSRIESLITRLEGPPGSAGLAGIQGEDGVDGSDGLDGSDGAPGEPGVEGPTGPAGPPGSPGMDAPATTPPPPTATTTTIPDDNDGLLDFIL